MRKLTISCLLACLLGLGACQRAPDEDDAEDVQARATVVVETASASPVHETISAYGLVGVAPAQSRSVEYAGEIQVMQLLVDPGMALASGAPLLRAQPSANARLELRKAQTDARYAQQAYARAQELYAQHLATRADLDLARQSADNASADLTSARARLGDGQPLLLRAERAGTVVSVDVTVGAIVPAGTALLHLADADALQVRLRIEAADLARIQLGQTVQLLATFDPSKQVHAVISDLVQQIDPQTRMAQAIVDLPASSSFIPGASVRGLIELTQRADAISVAHAAVLYAEDRPYVYVLGDGKAHQVWVELGQDDGVRTEIRSGINVGDAVVIVGNYVLTDGMAAAVATAPATP